MNKRAFLKNKIVLITGGTGSIGSELVRQILASNPKQVRVFSRDESKQYELMEKLGTPKNLRFLIGDVRDKDRLDLAFRDVDIVFHAAALKHVPFCEYNPFEAVKTNILGSQNVIDIALKHNVKKVVGISTDKVVNPCGVMGTSKLMMEKLFINANYYKGESDIAYSCVRFGNVAWARGSVLELWKRQAEKDSKIKITDGEMSRFIMSIGEAADLVLDTAELMKGGEIFILKMPAVKIIDLAKILIDKYYKDKKIKIVKIDVRPGEKRDEELLGDSNGDALVFENKKIIIKVPKVIIYSRSKENRRTYPGFRKVTDFSKYASNEHIDVDKVKRII